MRNSTDAATTLDTMSNIIPCSFMSNRKEKDWSYIHLDGYRRNSGQSNLDK